MKHPLREQNVQGKREKNVPVQIQEDSCRNGWLSSQLKKINTITVDKSVLFDKFECRIVESSLFCSFFTTPTSISTLYCCR